MNRTKLSLLVGVCLATPMAFLSPAHAQSASSSGGAGAGRDNVEVVVTAERRTSTVREVGFSIVAVSGEAMRTQQIHEPSGLTNLVPGFTLNNSDKSITVVQIRGAVSTFRTATLDAPIGFFVDDVYYPYSTDLNNNFYDLNHAEILRGPQGTLFGRNVTGGAIVIHTNDPTFDEDYLLSVTGGNAGLVRTEGMVNGTLIDGVLAGRVAFTTERTNGLIDTPNRPGNGGSGNTASGRGKLLWTPNENIRAVFSADYSDYSGEGLAQDIRYATTTGAPGFVPAVFTTFGAFNTGYWTDNGSLEQPSSVLQRGVAAHLDWDVLGGTLTSITSYRGTKTTSFVNNRGVAGRPALIFDSFVDNKWFTQELRFASAPGRFSYVAGLFFLDGDYHTINAITHAPMPGSPTFATYTINPFTAVRDQYGSVTSIAVFGEGVFRFTDDISLTLGGRWTRDDKDLDYRASSPTNDPTSTTQIPTAGYAGPIHAMASKSWEAFTPRVTLKWEPTDTINTYVTYSEGFKSGGYVDQSYTIAGATLPLPPEDTTNIEVGLKALLFDRRLNFNIALFNQETENLQNFSGSGGLPHAYSAASKIEGVEIETTWRVTDAFTIGVNYAYLDAFYTSNRDPLAPATNNAGNPLKYTPKNSGVISGSYEFGLANESRLVAQADFTYSDRFSTADNNSTQLYPEIYDNTEKATLNARLTYTSGDGRYSISAWGKNLTDHYEIGYSDAGGSFEPTPPAGQRLWRSITNTPRTFGVTLTLRR